MTKKIIKTLLFTIILGIVIFVGINLRNVQVDRPKSSTVFIGFPPSQTGIIKEYETISEEYQYVEKGYDYLKNGEIDKAIKQFNIVLKRNKETGAILDAKRGLINAYEKSKDYETAAALLAKIISTYKVPPDNPFRVPDEERLRYLRYAFEGEYALAIEHAKKALEADAQLPNRPKEGRSDYIERLNDLITAKDYILSLKKTNQ